MVSWKHGTYSSGFAYGAAPRHCTPPEGAGPHAGRARVILGAVEGGAGPGGADEVLRASDADVHLVLVLAGRPRQRREAGQLRRSHPLHDLAERVERVECPARDVACAGDADDERGVLRGQAGASYLLARRAQRPPRVRGVVCVRVRRADGEKRSRVAKREEAEAEPAQAVDHARHAGELAKGNQPRRRPASALADALVVDEPHLLLEDLVKKRHVLGLGLDDVAEEEVVLPGEERAVERLLDAHDGVGARKVTRDGRACRRKLAIGENALRRRLHEHLDARVDEPRDMGGSQRSATLPLGVRLGEDAEGTPHGLERNRGNRSGIPTPAHCKKPDSAQLSSPVLGVRLITALQVLQSSNLTSNYARAALWPLKNQNKARAREKIVNRDLRV